MLFLSSFAVRRGRACVLLLPDAPERKGGDLLGLRAGTLRQMGGDPRPREIGEGRGAGDATAAAERQPRRGMFDGLQLSAEPAKAAEPAQGAKETAAPNRGIFHGLKLSSRPPPPATAAPAQDVPGPTPQFRQPVTRGSRCAQGE